MNHNPMTNDEAVSNADMTKVFAQQKSYFRANSNTDLQTRQNNLARLKELLVRYQDQIIDALSEDYGQRARYDSLIADITPSLHLIDYNRKNLKKWMKPSRRATG